MINHIFSLAYPYYRVFILSRHLQLDNTLSYNDLLEKLFFYEQIICIRNTFIYGEWSQIKVFILSRKYKNE
jgi:hypothetical protein